MLKECVLLKKAHINITHALDLFGKNILTFEYHIYLSVECISVIFTLDYFSFQAVCCNLDTLDVVFLIK